MSAAWNSSSETHEDPLPPGLPSMVSELFDWVTGSELDDEDPAGGEGSLVDTGPAGSIVETLEQAEILNEHLREVPGLETMTTLAGAANTFLTHKPSTTGATAVAERLAVTGAGVVFGETPLGKVDALTGGNVRGVAEGGAESLFAIGDGIVNGDLEAMERCREHILSGEHGALAKRIGELGDFMGEAGAEVTLEMIEMITGEKQPRPPEEKGRAPITPREVQKTAEIMARSGGRGTVRWIDPEAEESGED